MDHGGEAVRPTTAGSTELGMASVVRGSEANIGSGAFDGQLGAAAAAPGSFTDFDLSAVAGRAEAPVAAEFHLHHEPGPETFAVAHPNIGRASWRQLGLVDVVLIGPQLPGGVVPVHDNYGYYSVLQPRPGAGRGVVLAVADLLTGAVGTVYSGDYALQPHPGAGHGEVLVNLHPDDAGHGEAFVGELPDGGIAAYDDYGFYALQLRPGAGHGEVLVDLLPDRAGPGHGEVFVGLLPGGAGHGEVIVGLLPGGGGGTVHDVYGYYPWQPRPGAGRGEVFIAPRPDGVGLVFDGLGNFAQHNLLGTGRADGIVGLLRDPNLGTGYDGSGALANDLGAVYNNPGMVAEQLHRLLPFAGIGACSVAVNGLAAGPGSGALASYPARVCSPVP